MNRRHACSAVLTSTVLLLAMTAPPAAMADLAKVLRLGTSDIDTLDPRQWQDTYSNTVGSAILEAMFRWDCFAQPARPVPNTAAAAPVVSADGRTWTFRLRPEIHFTDDPAFGRKPRERVAAAYVYTIKRCLDPNPRGGGEPLVSDLIVGMHALVDAVRKPGAKFNYDAPVEGIEAIDRHTLQIRIATPNYSAMTDVMVDFCAVAHDVIDAAGGDIQSRPVGTGPYRLTEWQRGSRVVLEANPRYRALALPQTDNPAWADLVRLMQGKRQAPDGKALTLSLLIFPGSVWREVQTLVKKNTDAIGVRMEAARTMHALVAAWAPMLPLMVDIENAFAQPWVQGYHRSRFGSYYQYLAIDVARRKATGE